MAALVQTISHPISTVTMLQTRPASSSGSFSNQNPKLGGVGGGSSKGGNYLQYRPNTSTGSYALNQIPGNNQNPLRQHPVTITRSEDKSTTASTGQLPIMTTNNPTPSPQKGEKSDTYFKPDSNRLSLLSTSLDLSLTDPRAKSTVTQTPPDRLRRTHKRSETTSGPLGGRSISSTSAAGKLYNIPSQSVSSPSIIGISGGDSKFSEGGTSRFDGRSIILVDQVKNGSGPHQPVTGSTPLQPTVRTWASVASTPYTPAKPEIPATKPEIQPSSANVRQNSNETVSTAPSMRQDSLTYSQVAASRNELKIVNIPPRGSSDITKRLSNPSLLSNPISASQEQAPTQTSFAKLVSGNQASPIKSVIESPAQQQLATTLSKKESKKDGKPSRLRRAFSFGSAAELRKASAENSHAATTRKLQKPHYETEEEAREAAIVKRQEASGLGNSIYSGQGNVFSSSTDNLSVSSTASSASIMLRKMGKGMKKGTRSLVGLFRPKSVIGIPAADAPVPESSMAEISMVTVEAEGERVNIDAHPSDQTGGASKYPKLERSSVDTDVSEPSLTTSDRSMDGVKSRKPVVNGDNDRVDVLAAVKKGILKRAGQDSGTSSPAIKSPDIIPPQVPRFDNSPHSSAPNTPDETAQRGHRRTDSVTIEGEDYFISVGRFTGSDSKSLPGTPKSAARNITFSPRIQFHDTWTATDYDRRGEIATCNRLTPTLAQAIKEELNTFKMVCLSFLPFFAEGRLILYPC